LSKEHEFLQQVLKGHRSAVLFCELLFRISQVMDDIYDGDKEVSRRDFTEMMWEALVELPSNEFYMSNFAVLQPLVRSALNDWYDANELEHSGEHDQSIAFILRDQLTGLVSQCAYLVGGYQWLRHVSAEVRRFFHDETLVDYMNGLGGVK